MFSQRILRSVDSPFRYGRRVAVSPHILTKDFGKDVLLFANPERLNREALDIISSSQSSQRPRAYWEVYCKRVNESIHLLPMSTIGNIVRSMENSPSSDLVTGFCKLLSDNLQHRPTVDVNTLRDMISVIRFFRKSLLNVEEVLYLKVLECLHDNILLLEGSAQLENLVEELLGMRSKLKRPHSCESERFLVKKLLRISETFSRDVSHTEPKQIEELARLLKA